LYSRILRQPERCANQRLSSRQFELKAESRKFWELLSEGVQLEKVAGGFGFSPHISHAFSGDSKRRARADFSTGLGQPSLLGGDCWRESTAEGAESGRDNLFVHPKTDFKHGSARPVVWAFTSSIG